MAQFRKGQIIRRITKDGAQIGPYMRIEHIEHDRLYAGILNEDTPNEMILKVNACIIPMPSLVVSESTIEKIKNHKQYRVSHTVNKVWEKVLNVQPSIVRFYSMCKSSDVIIKVETIYRTRTLSEICVNINIEHIISYN